MLVALVFVGGVTADRRRGIASEVCRSVIQKNYRMFFFYYGDVCKSNRLSEVGKTCKQRQN